MDTFLVKKYWLFNSPEVLVLLHSSQWLEAAQEGLPVVEWHVHLTLVLWANQLRQLDSSQRARIRHPDDVLEAGDWRLAVLLLEKTEAPVRGELRHDVAVKAMECPSHYVEEHASATKMIQQK